MIEQLSKTIYSICWPQTNVVFEELKALNTSPIFNETWTKKQDAMHIPYLDKWKKVFKEYISFNDKELKFSYPTNGSSESINMIMANLNTKGFEIVVFEEEYEGYTMVAKNLGMKVNVINRNKYVEEISNLIATNKSKLAFFISQPSSIDGNYWSGFNSLINFLDDTSIRVYLDVAYAGICEHPPIDVGHFKCIDGVIFSLSKVFGVYYHRIGGCFLREENPLLWPMLWFKNLHSIQYGILLLDAYEKGKYKDVMLQNKVLQRKIAEELMMKVNDNVILSDVPMIVLIKADYEKNPWLEQYKRSENNSYVRVCISQLLEKQMKS